MSFTDEQVAQVWAKAAQAGSENEKNGFRKDECGAWIKRTEHGNRNSTYGWEIDHIKAVSNDGSDAIGNLRPLQWQNNAAKSDGRLVCAVTSNAGQNIVVRS